MRKFSSAVLLFLFLLFFTLPVKSSADAIPYFTFSTTAKNASSGDLVKLQVHAEETADPAAGFRMIIRYDDKVLSFVRTETSSQIKSGTMATNSAGNPIYSVYVCNVDEKSAPELSGNIISFVFKVKDGVSDGKTSIGAHIDQICNFQAKQLNLDYDEEIPLTIVQPDVISDEAYLSELEPVDGRIRPDFSSDIYEYTMKVNYDVSSVEFAASAAENGTVKISRKSLGKTGTSTRIVATVTSEDKKNKTEYAILVSRDAAPSYAAAPAVKSETKREEDTRQQAVQQGDLPEDDGAKKKGSGGAVLAKQSEQSDTAKNSAKSPDPAEIPAVPASAAKAQPNYQQGERNLFIIGNQMPVFVIGMLVALLCIMVGIALSFWLRINQLRQPQDKKQKE
jgi:hypothetical protein